MIELLLQSGAELKPDANPLWYFNKTRKSFFNKETNSSAYPPVPTTITDLVIPSMLLNLESEALRFQFCNLLPQGY